MSDFPVPMAFVRREDWAKVVAGDTEALEKVRGELADVCLYDHAVSLGSGDWMQVTIAQLFAFGVVEAVDLRTRFFNTTKRRG